MSPAIGTVAGILQVITTIEPLAGPVVAGLATIFQRHPSITPDQWLALLGQMVPQIHAENATTIADATADQAAKPA
jgi:hypothetical protein